MAYHHVIYWGTCEDLLQELELLFEGKVRLEIYRTQVRGNLVIVTFGYWSYCQPLS